MSSLTLAVLFVVLWRVETIGSGGAHLSGQWIQEGGVRTERFVGEGLEVWAARHREAVERMTTP